MIFEVINQQKLRNCSVM